MGLFSKPEVVIYKESNDAKEYLRQLEELYAKARGEAKKLKERPVLLRLVLPEKKGFFLN